MTRRPLLRTARKPPPESRPDRSHQRRSQLPASRRSEGTTIANYWTPEGDKARQALNEWIRTSKAYNAVIDFEGAVRDPAIPTRMLAKYASEDHLHPNDAGYQAMAEAIDLALFKAGAQTTSTTR